MKLTSARIGFATNSSSSHSVVYGGSSKVDFKKLVENYSGTGETEFGWQMDEYSDLSSIANYGAILLFGSLLHSENKKEFDSELDNLMDNGEVNIHQAILLEKIYESIGGSYFYIDHQSAGDPYWHEAGTRGEKLERFVCEVSSIITDNDNH